MCKKALVLALIGAGFVLVGCTGGRAPLPQAAATGDTSPAIEETPPGAIPLAELPQTETAWRGRLTPEQFHVTRERGTEPPFANAYWETKAPGVFRCIGCGVELFSAHDKFDSGTGWPSFTRPSHPEFVAEEDDFKLSTQRTEVHCRRCGAHLGHVFDDGPQPTGLRYCLNSAALRFDPVAVAAAPAATTKSPAAAPEEPPPLAEPEKPSQ